MSEKKEKLRQRQKTEEKKYGREIQFCGKSLENNKKFRGTLSQTFKDSKKYKKLDDKDFFNTRNFLNNNGHYYNSAQRFNNSNCINS